MYWYSLSKTLKGTYYFCVLVHELLACLKDRWCISLNCYRVYTFDVYSYTITYLNILTYTITYLLTNIIVIVYNRNVYNMLLVICNRECVLTFVGNKEMNE